MGELLILIAKKNMSHTVSKQCLFDECENRSELYECIKNASICPECVAKLKGKNVNHHAIESALCVLRWCKRNQWSFVGRFTVSHSVTALSVGTALGWYASTFVIREWAWVLALVTLTPVLFLVAYARFVLKGSAN